jgi:hypothetical protein
MLNKLTTAAGIVLLVSSFALAGQAPTTTNPAEQPKVAQSPSTPPNTTTAGAKKHHKHHKHHKKAQPPASQQ